MRVLGLTLAGTLLLAQSVGADEWNCTAGAIPEERAARARAYLERLYPPGDTPGVSVLVSCLEEPVFTYDAGLANLEWGQPISGDTSFRIGSISKPLTSVAVLQLVERDLIALDEPISRYIPRLPGYMRLVTTRQLLSHTSGLPDVLLTPALLPLARDWVSARQVIGMQARTPPKFSPGERFDYSNFNYVLLAALIESVTDMDYGEYMARAIFAPLGMTRSHYDERREILFERAEGYETSPFGRLLKSENIDMSHASAAGALLSSTRDLVRWSSRLLAGDLLTRASLDAAWTPPTLPGGETSSYGLGFNVSEQFGQRVIWHNGLASGFQGALSIYPETGLIVVVLGNGFHLPNTTEAMDRVAGLLLGHE